MPTHSSSDLVQRLRRLEDRLEIRELAGRYGFAIDDRNIADLERLFTPDAVFRSKDGVMDARGREEVIAQFGRRFSVLGISNHFTHDHLIALGDDPDSATGLVSSHAEVWRNDQALLGALRYEDKYRRHEGRWCFAERLLSFLYYMPVNEYAEGMGGRMRQRAYGDRRPADYPEALDSWRAYHGAG
jgi:hypothetical protein